MAASVGGEYRPFAECTAGFDIIINATALRLAGMAPPLPQSVLAGRYWPMICLMERPAKPFMILPDKQRRFLTVWECWLNKRRCLMRCGVRPPQTKKIIAN